MAIVHGVREFGVPDRRQLVLGAGLVAVTGLASACGQATAAATDAKLADGLARFNLRENPWGPSPKAIAAIHDQETRANRYAGDEKKAFVSFIAQQDGVAPEQVLPANGSKPILAAMGAWLGRKGGEVVTASQTYRILYESAEAFGATITKVPLTPEWDFDYAAMLPRIGPSASAVYVCNPNGSTGRLTDPDTLKAFVVEAAKVAPVFVDEAYLDMTDAYPANSMTSLVREGHNVVVSRTLSKLHGLAGQRIGYAIGPVELIKATQALLTDHVNRAGLVAGLASLEDTSFQAATRAKIVKGRVRLESIASENGLSFVPGSVYNGVLIDVKMPVEQLYPKLLAEGVLINEKGPKELPTWVSICVGTEPEMDRLAVALKKSLA